MSAFLANILLALVWMALTGFTVANFITGFILSYLALWVSQRAVTPSKYFVRVSRANASDSSSNYITKIPRVIGFIFYFIWELILANWQVAYEIITPKFRMRPGVIAIPLDIKTDAEITLLANLITLTPGTLSLDVSDDRRTLYIHGMYIGDDVEKFRRSIKDGFEKRIREVFE